MWNRGIRAMANGNNQPSLQHTDFKAKFTVSVRGHQWTSARHIRETLQDFSKVIEKNGRKLGFLGEEDRVERLQLARADGTETEELDVDATLEDVLICKGNKQLVALIGNISSNDNVSAEPLLCIRDVHHHQFNLIKPTAVFDLHQTPAALQHLQSSFSLAAPTPAPSTREQFLLQYCVSNSISGKPPSPHHGATAPFNTSFDHHKPGSPFTDLQHFAPLHHINPQELSATTDISAFKKPKHLRVTIPDLDSDQMSSPVLNSNFPTVNLQRNFDHDEATTPDSTNNPSSRTYTNPENTPNPATELTPFVLRNSFSVQCNNSVNHGLSNNSFSNLSQPAATVAPNLPLLASAFTSTGFIHDGSGCIQNVNPRNKSTISSSNTGTLQFHDPNIAVLAQFLASQLGGVFNDGCNDQRSASAIVNDNIDTLYRQAANLPPAAQNFLQNLDACPPEPILQQYQGTTVTADNYRNVGNSGAEYHCRSAAFDCDHDHSPIESYRPEKDQSSSSANDAHNGAHAQVPEMVFLVNRRSKTGRGTHRLKMSELSSYFHLSVVDAAKKLGVSQTTLKKACRKFGLKRWPGRKVRSLESTINGLEHTIAIGQEAGMEELTEAQIRSEVLKLQQEMEHLVNGLPSMQHPTALKTADLYKRLSSRGWKSKNQSGSEKYNALDRNIIKHGDQNEGTGFNDSPGRTLVSSRKMIDSHQVMYEKGITSRHVDFDATGGVDEANSTDEKVTSYDKVQNYDHGHKRRKIVGADFNNRQSDVSERKCGDEAQCEE